MSSKQYQDEHTNCNGQTAVGRNRRQDLTTNNTVNQTISNHLNEIQQDNDLARPPSHGVPTERLSRS